MITMRASGVGLDIGAAAAQAIETEFRKHHAWHQRVTCSFADGTLTLVALNDFDFNGLALSDEFSDCLSAFIPSGGLDDTGIFEVVAVEKV